MKKQVKSSSLVVEEMILLSNVIKSSLIEPKNHQKRVIGLKSLQTSGNKLPSQQLPDSEFLTQKLLDDAKEQADKIVQDAISYSNSLRQQVIVEKQNWEEEKQALFTKSSAEGFQTGLVEGREQGYQEYTSLLAEARQIIDASKHDYNQYLESSEEVIVKLAMTVAEKIIGVHLSENPDDFVYLTKNALKEVKEHSDITIQVHPLFYQVVVQRKEELSTVLNKETDLFIYPNEELNEQDCVIESSFGKVNASVDTQLSEIKEKLLSLLLEE